MHAKRQIKTNRYSHGLTPLLLVSVFLALCLSCNDSLIVDPRNRQATSYYSIDASWSAKAAGDVKSVTGTLFRDGTLLQTVSTDVVSGTEASLSGTTTAQKGVCDLSITLTDADDVETTYRAGTVQLTDTLKNAETVDLKGKSYITSLVSSASFVNGGSIDVPIAAYPENATIHYTTDGSDPTVDSTLYTGPIHLTETTTVKAIATAEGYTDSDITEGLYTETGNFSISVPSYDLGIAIETNDYKTYIAVVRNETDMNEKQYSWYVKGIKQADDNHDHITLDSLVPGHYRIMVTIQKGGGAFFSEQKSFDIPENTEAEK